MWVQREERGKRSGGTASLWRGEGAGDLEYANIFNAPQKKRKIEWPKIETFSGLFAATQLLQRIQRHAEKQVLCEVGDVSYRFSSQHRSQVGLAQEGLEEGTCVLAGA